MKLTAALMSLNIAFYAALAYASSSALRIDEAYILKYGLNKEAFLAGAYWQIFTSLFLHFDFPHLGYNMVFLAIFGSRAEEIYGKKFLPIYLACGLLAALAMLAYPPRAVSAGASGAIFGVLGANLIAQRNLYPRGVYTSLLYGFIFFMLAAATGFLAHLLGLVFGFIIGYWVTRNWYPESKDF
jgi:membrane associated rhomboid family serine protease